jgi:hypothetical protein
MKTPEDTTQHQIENKRSVTAGLAFIIGFSLLLIGFILIMRTLFAPKAQYDGKSSTGQLEQDQEGQFYQTEQNVSQPDPATIPQTDNAE